MIVYLVVLPTILLHFAFAGCRINLSLFALSLQASPFTVGVIVSLLALLPMTFAISAGRIIDRIGVQKPMLLGACSTIAGLTLAYAMPRLEMLFIASPLVGAGFMLYHIAVNHAAGTLGRPEDRVRNFSLLALTFSTSNFLGPMLTGFAIDWIGFRHTFLLLAGSAAAQDGGKAIQKTTISLGTATPGGGFPLYGDAFAQVMNEADPTLSIEPRNTKGSTENIPLLEAGSLEESGGPPPA